MDVSGRARAAVATTSIDTGTHAGMVSPFDLASSMPLRDDEDMEVVEESQ
jgi:hypothetical protein